MVQKTLDLFAERDKMAESLPYFEWSTEVSFMDWPMCACSVQLRQEGAEQQVQEITAAVFLAQFSASLGFACLFIDWLRVGAIE